MKVKLIQKLLHKNKVRDFRLLLILLFIISGYNCISQVKELKFYDKITQQKIIGRYWVDSIGIKFLPKPRTEIHQKNYEYNPVEYDSIKKNNTSFSEGFQYVSEYNLYVKATFDTIVIQDTLEFLRFEVLYHSFKIRTRQKINKSGMCLYILNKKTLEFSHQLDDNKEPIDKRIIRTYCFNMKKRKLKYLKTKKEGLFSDEELFWEY